MEQNPMNPSPATNIDWYNKFLAMEHQHIRATARLNAMETENVRLKRIINELMAQLGSIQVN